MTAVHPGQYLPGYIPAAGPPPPGSYYYPPPGAFAPPPPVVGYQPPPVAERPAQNQTIVVNNNNNNNNDNGNQQARPRTPPIIIGSSGDTPMRITCPACQQRIVTSLKHHPGSCTWLVFGILFVLGIWPCCLIPFCSHSCQDVDHRCPNCNHLVSKYKRLCN
ncbi:lipopolysaccharide-induced tumor necrosis factor-alpha factor homolog [Pleurodeles waltl]|uniref:lipopolysaccharide-induced tumor necrosis factor-alpha factor homolog n=1 Tax=Pleurodeles waltl TaxID=8319 RepID=UPI0037095849